MQLIHAQSGSGGLEDETCAVGDTIEIGIVAFTFRPRLVVVNAGARVGWINHDEIPHAVRFGRVRIKSPVLLRDDRFSHRFTEPGTYDYICPVDPSMCGTIIVTG